MIHLPSPIRFPKTGQQNYLKQHPQALYTIKFSLFCTNSYGKSGIIVYLIPSRSECSLLNRLQLHRTQVHNPKPGLAVRLYHKLIVTFFCKFHTAEIHRLKLLPADSNGILAALRIFSTRKINSNFKLPRFIQFEFPGDALPKRIVSHQPRLRLSDGSKRTKTEKRR